MLRLLILVALASLCSAGNNLGGYKQAMMKKYAHFKMNEACFGKEMMKEYKMKMMEASKTCGGRMPGDATDHIDYKDIINEIRSAALQMGSRNSPVNQYFQLVPVLQGGRYRRDANASAIDHSAEKLQYLQDKMTHKISNVTCMLRELDWIKEDKTPNYELFEAYINKLTDPFLRDQILYGMDMCKALANCLPVKKAKNPFMKELGTFVYFERCCEMKKLEACFKKDFRENMAEYGFDAVEQKINMGLEMLGEEQEEEGFEAYHALEDALSGAMF